MKILYLVMIILVLGGCAQKGVEVVENEIVLGKWEVIGDENGKYLDIHKDKAEYRKDSFSPLRVFRIAISKLSNMLFNVGHAFGSTKVEVIGGNLILADGRALKRAGTECERTKCSQVYGIWKGKDFIMKIGEGEVCFDEEEPWKILEVYRIEKDYVFLTEDEFVKHTLILKASGDLFWIFGEYSGEIRRI